MFTLKKGALTWTEILVLRQAQDEDFCEPRSAVVLTLSLSKGGDGRHDAINTQPHDSPKKKGRATRARPKFEG